MTKKRKIHQLKGTIKYAFEGISKSKIYKKQPFYCLEIQQQTWLETKKENIFVFPNLVSSEIWNTLCTDTFKDKPYFFYCEKRTRGWRLKDWEEIKPDPQL